MATMLFCCLPSFVAVVLLLALSSNPSEAWTRSTLADRLTGRLPMNTLPYKSLTRRNAQNNNNNNNNAAATSTAASTKQNQREMMDFIQRPMESTVGDSISSSSVDNNDDEDDDLDDLIRCIVKAADGRKAEDIVVLRVDHVTTLTAALVILSGNSRPQNQAIAAAITKSVQEDFDDETLRPGGNGVPEGSAASGWMLLDYGQVMVHIMTEKSRLYYNVEGQWRDKGGKYMDISDMLLLPDPSSSLAGNNNNHKDAAGSAAGSASSEQDDPFWS